jgi:hypothetical protein
MTTSDKQNMKSPSSDEITPAQIRWIETSMSTSFANVVNVQSTREQVDLFFGTNRTWNPEANSEVTVELNNRVILTPFAAKRLATVLSNVLTEYESRFGVIDITR